MKKLTLLLLLLIHFTITEAQKVYFVYLQSENQEQFYARLGEKIYNSSSSGYLILSKLVDSTYGMHIGVSGSQSPEQLFSIIINKKDKGYVIKNFGEKGWGLFDLQSFAVIMPAASNAMKVVQTEKRESNPFTDLLAKAADDSTIKERPVVQKEVEKKVEAPVLVVEKKEEIKKLNIDSVSIKRVGVNQSDIPVLKKEEIQDNSKDSIIAKEEEKKTEILAQGVEKKEKLDEQKTDSVNFNANEVIPVIEKKVEENTETPVIPVIEKKATRNPFADEFQKSIVVKRSESSTTEGFGITFLDVTGDGSIDTVRILIPTEKAKPVYFEIKKEDLKFLDIVSTDTTKTQIKEELKEKKIEDVKPVTIEKSNQEKNNCMQVAGDDDFFTLRKKMAAEVSNDDMISEAKKIFRSKCFSTEQIKNLSTLFLSDEGKYHFFDASYSYVSDREKFVLLHSELKDEYYINRFKSMLY